MPERQTEAAQQLEAELLALLAPPERLALEDCQPGLTYWAEGGGRGPTAVCLKDYNGQLFFMALSEQEGIYSAQPTEYNDDTDAPGFGTLTPYAVIDANPAPQGGEELESWLLEHDIAFVNQQLEYLVSLPAEYQATLQFEVITEKYQRSLEQLQAVRASKFKQQMCRLYAATFGQIETWTVHKRKRD